MTVRLCFPKSYHLQIPAFTFDCDHSSIKLFFSSFLQTPERNYLPHHNIIYNNFVDKFRPAGRSP